MKPFFKEKKYEQLNEIYEIMQSLSTLNDVYNMIYLNSINQGESLKKENEDILKFYIDGNFLLQNQLQQESEEIRKAIPCL